MSQVVPTKILDPDSLQRRTPCLDVDLAHRLTSKAEHVRWVIADLLPDHDRSRRSQRLPQLPRRCGGI